MEKNNFSMPIDRKSIKITDVFWQREQELVRTQVIPYQWEALNDRVSGAAPSYCMHNFKVAGKMMQEKRQKGSSYEAPSFTFRGFEALPEDPQHPDDDKFYGYLFQDTDFSKWIEAVAYSLAQYPDAQLEQTADEAIDIVCAAQLENGYLDTFYIINGMDRSFTNLKDHHELYCLGHLVEGAVAYYEATGKDKLLKAACRFADYVADYFGVEEGKCKGYPGHEIAEMALVRLYQTTQNEKYLELSRYFIHQRGTSPKYFEQEDAARAKAEGRTFKPDQNPLSYSYYQAHKPVHTQDEALGHAVRAVYLYSGMADVARLTQDEALLAACERLWNNIVNEKLYITGGIGATHLGEAFSFGYDLPNDTAYSETCAAIGLAFFARRMLEIKADSRYADVMEQALYNTVLSGMALDGKSFFYVNPLEVVPEACHKDERKAHVKPVRQKWFGCACCPPNISRIITSISDYAYTEKEDTLWVHLYMGSVLTKQIADQELHIKMETQMPWQGTSKVTLQTQEPVKATLAFRIPGWCKTSAQTPFTYQYKQETAGCLIESKEGNFKITGDITEETISFKDGYLYLTGVWKSGDTIQIDFPMEAHMLMANPMVREDISKAAFTRGPITYCMEEADNGKNLHLCRIDADRIRAEESKTGKWNVGIEMTQELGHEMAVLKVPGLRETQNAQNSLYAEYQPVKTQETELTLVPYYAWSNRGEGEMSVWIRI